MDFSKEGTTSVKVHHAPGGKSNFSLGWDSTEAPKKTNPKAEEKKVVEKEPEQNDGKTSVKVHNPPGGKSNFSLG